MVKKTAKEIKKTGKKITQNSKKVVQEVNTNNSVNIGAGIAPRKKMNNLVKIGIACIALLAIFGSIVGVSAAIYKGRLEDAKLNISSHQEGLQPFISSQFEGASTASAQIDDIKESLSIWNPASFTSAESDAANIVSDLESKFNQQVSHKQERLSEVSKIFTDELYKLEALDLPNKDLYIETADELDKAQLNEDLSLEEMDTQIAKAEESYSRILEDTNQYQKESLVESLNSITDLDVPALVTYFSARSGYETELAGLSTMNEDIVKFKKNAVDNDIKFSDFNKFAEEKIIAPHTEFMQSQQEVINIEEEARRLEEEARIKEEEARRQELIAKQQEIWNQRGITPPASPGGEYKQILVDVSQQYMYLFENGELIESAAVVTGKQDYDTVRGRYSIYLKEADAVLTSPFEDEEYEVPVNYWIPFYSGYGIHDAVWRTSFGGDDFGVNGSHGCVNSPLWIVEFIWNWAPVGTPVYVVD